MKSRPVILLVCVLICSLLATPGSALAAPIPAPTAEESATVRLAIPAAAFLPFEDGYVYTKTSTLKFVSKPGGGTGVFVAPVYLPHGARVNQFGIYRKGLAVASIVKGYLHRTQFTLANFTEMASIDVIGAGYVGNSDGTIINDMIDNTQYAYWVTVVMDGEKSELVEAYVDYEPPAVADPGKLSVPAAAFSPFTTGYDYVNHGRFIEHKAPAAGFYLAPLILPDGARINNITLRTQNPSPNAVELSGPGLLVQRTELGKGNFTNLVTLEPAKHAGSGSSTVFPPGGLLIDYSKYAYWLTWDPPAPVDVRLKGVMIEYTPPAASTGRVMIPAPAFTISSSDYRYENHGRFVLSRNSDDTHTTQLRAPLVLPENVYITKLTLHYQNGTAPAQYYAHFGGVVLAYHHVSSDEWGALTLFDTFSDHTTLWNKLTTALIKRQKTTPIYTYNLVLNLNFVPAGATPFQAAAIVIEYSTKKPTWLYMPIMKKK